MEKLTVVAGKNFGKENTVISEKKITSETLSVFPSAIQFKNVEVNGTYECSISLQNLTSEMKKVRLSFANYSKSKCFYINGTHEAEITAASGLDKKISVEFIPNEERDFTEMLIIKADTDVVEIPIKGYLIVKF
jgi:hypothetical protein